MLRSILVLCLFVVVPVSWGQVVPMTNDECSSAITVGNGTNPGGPTGVSGNFYTNVGATQSPSFICVSGTQLDVWFAYTAAATGTITVTTCPPPAFSPGSLDTVLTVFDGAACPPSVNLGCNDDACSFWSTVNAPVTAGGLYYFRVSGLFGSTGTFYLTITPPAVPVTNDECASPIALSVGTNGPYSNATATSSPGVSASCGGGSPGYRDLWFSFTAPCSTPVTINTGCNGFDTILTAYTSCGGPEIACSDDVGGPCGLSSSITFAATAGVQYRIRAAAFSPSNTGLFPINVTLGNGLGLVMSSPFGPGSIQVSIAGGLPLGTYFLGVTFFAGAYPNGWLFGVDLPLAELQNLLNVGPPFLGTLGVCGDLTIGPFGGVGSLSGVPIYAVVLVMPPGSSIPTAHSAPVTYTIP